MIEEKLCFAEKGRAFWLSLTEKQKNKTLYLLFCGEDEILEQIAMDFLRDLSSHRKAERVVILTCQESFSVKTDGVVVELISEEIKESLLCLYEMYQFTEDLLMISLTRPYGSKHSHLLKEGFSKEEILKQCIFRLE